MMGHLSKRHLGTLALLALLMLSPPVTAESLRVFELQHRSGEELIPLLRPLLAPDAGLSATGHTLIVRAHEQDLLKLGLLLDELDRPRRQFLVTISQGGDGRQQHRSIDVDTGSNTAGRTQVYSTRRHQQHQEQQQLRISEGEWAMIRAGQAIPQAVQHEHHGPGGITVERRIEYRDVDTGFEVRITRSGERLHIESRPHYAKQLAGGRGEITQQEVHTRLTTTAGEWVLIAGSESQHKRDGAGTIYSTRQRHVDTQQVWLKIDEIP